MRAVAILAVCLVLAACGRPDTEFTILNSVPDFQLTSQDGQPFRGSALAGKVWVADFMFTNCTGPCPRMTGQLRKVQLALPDASDVRFVSFTVDPERDTPEALTGYARRMHADTSNWVFLTGPQADLHHLARKVFLLGNVDGQLDHATRFVLVDRQMQIRATYDTSEPDAVSRVIRDVHRLLKERA